MRGSKTQSIYAPPKDSGSIFECDIFKIHHNLLDVLTRRQMNLKCNYTWRCNKSERD
ncbi:MAG: DUF1926 domain-containing protein [Endomicrobium sp.]|nr:DUF1926 domain-containing protein [Endomicrobium sp.]